MAEKTSDKDNKKEKSVFVLYIPGGAMLGIIPAMVLAHLEDLTETPAHQLFQAADGVSTGSIIVAALNADIPAKDTAAMFCENGPKFFPEVPGRYRKMITADFIDVAQDLINPIKSENLILKDINRLCVELSAFVKTDQKEAIEELHKFATQQWLTKASQKKALALCETIKEAHTSSSQKKNINKVLSEVSELVFVRVTTGTLSKPFRKAALNLLETVKPRPSSYLYDSGIAKNIFRNLIGDMRMNQCLTSTYISTYDKDNNKIKTFSSRKKDILKELGNGECITSKENAMLWDAVMASTANPFAYRHHVSEDGTKCADKAIVHSPLLAVNDILAHKPQDANVKLVVLGTGKYLSSSQEEDRLREEYARYGVAGNLLRGRETAELESYTMSSARKALYSSLGKDNIIEISPLLAPRSYDESKEFPNKDPLDASADNIRKIVKRANLLIKEEDTPLRELAHSMVKNLYNLGQMDQAKFDRVSKKIAAPSQEVKNGLNGCFEKAISAGEDKSFKARIRKAGRAIARSLSYGT